MSDWSGDDNEIDQNIKKEYNFLEQYQNIQIHHNQASQDVPKQIKIKGQYMSVVTYLKTSFKKQFKYRFQVHLQNLKKLRQQNKILNDDLQEIQEQIQQQEQQNIHATNQQNKELRLKLNMLKAEYENIKQKNNYLVSNRDSQQIEKINSEIQDNLSKMRKEFFRKQLLLGEKLQLYKNGSFEDDMPEKIIGHSLDELEFSQKQYLVSWYKRVDDSVPENTIYSFQEILDNNIDLLLNYFQNASYFIGKS